MQALSPGLKAKIAYASGRPIFKAYTQYATPQDVISSLYYSFKKKKTGCSFV